MNNVSGSNAQQRNIRRTVTVIAALVVLLVAGFFFNALRPRPMSALELQVNNAFVFDTPRSLPAFTLQDADGNAFTEKNLAGKWRLVFFGFTFCPDICPTTMSMLNRFYGELPAQLQASTTVMMTSVDPARDTPAVLKPYIGFFNPDFAGLTGDFIELHRFATALNMPFVKVPGEDGNYQVDHSGNIAILSERGHYVGFFRTPLDIEKMKKVYLSLRAMHD